MRRGARLVVVATCLTLSALVVAGIVRGWLRLGPFYPFGLALILGTEWGQVMTLDFVLCLVFGGCWMMACERRWWRGAALTVAAVVLGTPVLLLYLAARTRRARSLRELFIGGWAPDARNGAIAPPGASST
jgi:hypothetical protein